MGAVRCAGRSADGETVAPMARSLRALIGPAALAAAMIMIAPVDGLAQTQPPAAEKFVLSGVIVFEGGKGLAWIQEPTLTGNQVIPLRPGDTLGPYRLSKVLEDRVELDGPAGTVLVPVNGASSGPSVAAAASARDAAPMARPPRTDVDPGAMTRREVKDAADRLRQAKQTFKQDSRQQAQNPTQGQDDNSKGRRAGRRGGKNSDSSASSSGFDSSGGGSGSNVTISRGDSRRNGFQSATRSGAQNN
jgi:uncharacterized membrane protein YgcG